MTKPKIYFAGSITGGRGDSDLYFQIIELLKSYGTILTEHIGSKTLTSGGENKTSEFIFNRDINWVDEADIVVAEVSTPSLGVGYEIGRAENKKPILCLFRDQPDKRLSAMIASNSNLKIGKYKNIEDITVILKDFFATAIK